VNQKYFEKFSFISDHT